MATRYTQPQAGPIEAINEVHSALTPATEKGGKFRLVKGPAWTANNVAALSTAVRKSGTVVVNSSNGYWQRDNPFQSGPLTVCFSHTPSTVSGTVGLWSIGFSAQTGGPNLIIQRDGAALKFYAAGGFRLTIPSAFSVGVPARIALSIYRIEGGSSQDNFLALNGTLYALTNYNSVTEIKYFEFLGSGYNGQGAGDYGEYFALQRRCSPSELVAFTTNPYQLFKPKLIPPLIASALGGDATATGSPDSITVSPATATATATKSATASGAFATISLSAPTATATGTSAGNAIATGTPAQITISQATAIAIGSAVASGGLQSIGITAPSATASVGNGNATATGAWAALSITAPTGYASSGFIRAPSGIGPAVIQPGSTRPRQSATSRPSNTGGRRY